MPRGFRRGLLLCGILILSLALAGFVVALAGLLGRSAREIAWNTWADANTIADNWYNSLDKLGKLVGFLITLGSGVYAIRQKLYFAEWNMHIRLREFQERVETRLKDANKEVDMAVLRPGPSRPFEHPIFTDETLNPVLQRMKWGRRSKADESLEMTLAELQKQLGSWDGQRKEYELRKAQALLLKGAIAAARAAKKTGEETRADNVEALSYFQEAFNLSKESDTEALEYIGHQQVRLGDHDPAFLTFRKLAEMAPASSLLRARALKYQAEVCEFRTPPNFFGANSALIAAVEALPIDAELLERAEIHEIHGRVREKAKIGLATQSYTEAERLYHRIASTPAATGADGAEARPGLARVREALQRIRLRSTEPATPNGKGVPPILT
jgi:hypothetical protein